MSASLVASDVLLINRNTAVFRYLFSYLKFASVLFKNTKNGQLFIVAWSGNVSWVIIVLDDWKHNVKI